MDVYRLNIPCQHPIRKTQTGQLGFGYMIDEITWVVKTHGNEVLEIFDDELNNKFELCNLKNPTW